jgi:hypothetical protein
VHDDPGFTSGSGFDIGGVGGAVAAVGDTRLGPAAQALLRVLLLKLGLRRDGSLSNDG